MDLAEYIGRQDNSSSPKHIFQGTPRSYRQIVGDRLEIGKTKSHRQVEGTREDLCSKKLAENTFWKHIGNYKL